MSRPRARRCNAVSGSPTSRVQPLCPSACARVDRTASIAPPSTRGSRAVTRSTIPSLGSARARGNTSVLAHHTRTPLVLFNHPTQSRFVSFISTDRDEFTYGICVILVSSPGRRGAGGEEDSTNENVKMVFFSKHAKRDRHGVRIYTYPPHASYALLCFFIYLKRNKPTPSKAGIVAVVEPRAGRKS